MCEVISTCCHAPEKEAFNAAFLALKSVCDKIALNPKQDSSKNLADILDKIDHRIIQELQLYIVYPLQIHLFNIKVNSDQTVCILLKTLKIALSHFTLVDTEIFLKIYHTIFIQLEEEKKPGSIRDVSEELKLNAVQCTQCLFQAVDKSVLMDLYDFKNYPKLSCLVYKCCLLAKNEGFILLRVEALKCILAVAQCTKPDLVRNELYDKVAKVITLMIPGISTVCVSIASGSDTQNHQVVKMAIQVWSRIVALVMKDAKLCSNEPTEMVFKLEAVQEAKFHDSVPFDKEHLNRIIQEQRIDNDWIQMTANKLSQVTKVMVTLQLHPNWKVRHELAQGTNLMLKLLPSNTPLYLGTLLDSLILLSQDDHSLVVEESNRAISNFAEKCSNSIGKSLLEVVEENFYALITRLPMVLHRKDENKQLTDLSLLAGYLKILHLQTILNYPQYLNRLFVSLITALTLDCSRLSLLEELSIRDIQSEVPVLESGWKQLKYCYKSELQEKIYEVCRILNKSSEISSLIYALLDMFNINVTNRKEIIYLINEIVTSGPPGSMKDQFELISAVVETYTDNSVWYVPVSISKDGADSITTAQQNVVQKCLLCEGLGRIAVCLGPALFSPLLFKCLYPLLECAGSPLYIIAAAGLKSVKLLADVYGGGVTKLVGDNVDLLSHHVTIRLRKGDPHVLAVLTVIMKHSTIEVLPSLHEIIDNVLIQSCDRHQNLNASAYLHVFHTFVDCVQNWLKKDKVELSEKKEPEVKKSLIDKLLEQHNARIESNKLLEEDEPEIEESELTEYDVGTEDKQEKKDVPENIKLIIAILKRSMNFLPSKDVSRQILVLQILKGGVLILSDYEDQLLPVVHEIWSPLLERFRPSNHPLIIQRAFSLLTVLASTSKDFIRARTVKEVIPWLCTILERSANESKLKDSGHAYRLGQLYKLQLCLLQGMGTLLINMDVNGKDLFKVVKTCLPYLSSLQPQPLQDACLDVHRKIAQLNGDIVWLHLVSLCPKSTTLTPPIAGLRSYKLDPVLSRTERIYYEKNVGTLLSELF